MLFESLERLRGWLMPRPFWIRKRGAWGEYLVRRLFHRRGYHCLEKNWRHQRGEIDLIMACKTEVVFLEVKTRKAHPDLRLGDTLSHAQKERLKRLAKVYLDQWQTQKIPWRFQLAVVQVSSNGTVSIEEATLS